jgi:hypothetical protein
LSKIYLQMLTCEVMLPQPGYNPCTSALPLRGHIATRTEAGIFFFFLACYFCVDSTLTWDNRLKQVYSKVIN